MHDIRCPHKKHGAMLDEYHLEVKCDSRYCGAGNGTTVLHTFDVRTGEMISTHKYNQPMKERK